MIRFLINDGGVRQTAPVLTSMLNESSDDALLLAHGYVDSQTLEQLNLPRWLSRSKKRRLILLVGLHDKGGVGYASTNPKLVEAAVRYLCRNWELPDRAADRVLIYAVEHFHAKFAAVGRFIDDPEMASTFTMDPQRSLLFSPREVVFGSSNLTQAALHGRNIELDVHIPRGSAALGEFVSKMHTVVSRAIALTNEPGTFSQEFTLNLRGILNERVEELALHAAKQEARAMDAYSAELIKNLNDPDK